VKPKVIFEVGTFDGYTSLHLAMNAGPDAQVYTLDLPVEGANPELRTTWVDVRHIEQHAQMRQYLFDGRPEAKNITCLFGDSATFDYEPYAGKVDLFFIDGAHSYEYVRSDTLNALRCSHKGSIIAWHDFGRTGVNGVSKWLMQFSREHEIYSVPGGSLAYMVVE
jgi:predicted O-methyltransferase YrrM